MGDAVAVAQLADWPFTTPEARGSNEVFGKIYAELDITILLFSRGGVT